MTRDETPREATDPDALNRPVREAARGWARERGIGFSEAFHHPTRSWCLRCYDIQIRVDVMGHAHVEGESGVAKSARGMTMLLNKIEKART